MSCATCSFWVRGKRTVYVGNGQIIDSMLPKPKCSQLQVETPEDFACIRFEEGQDKQVELLSKTGEPWQHWYYGPCPGCQGVGSSPGFVGPDGVGGGGGSCHRCAGTSKVRYYDDGYIGEEQHRVHPMEVRLKKLSQVDQLQAQIDALKAGMPEVPDATKLNAPTRREGMISGGGDVI